MVQRVEKTGRTVQEAIDAALEELHTVEDNVHIEVLDEGTKGIFGLIGNKVAKVRVTLIKSAGEAAKEFLSSVFGSMDLKADMEIEENEESLLIRIRGNNIGIIIGRRGETLDSLQYLTSLIVNRNRKDYRKRVIIDIENYRQKREETLVKLAHRLAERVVKYRKNITLEPMNPYERRIIHSSLQNNKLVNTYSVGEEPNRRVVITLKK